MRHTDNIEIRRVQAFAGERSFTLVFPKQFAIELGIRKGDFMKCRVEDRRLILEKLLTDENTGLDQDAVWEKKIEEKVTKRK